VNSSVEKGEWPTEKLPASWTWVGFDEFWTDYTDAKRKLPQKDYLASGTLPVVDQGADLIGGYTDDTGKRSLAPLPVVIFGDHTRAVKFIDQSFVQGADGVRVLRSCNGVEPAFAFHALRCVSLPDKGYSRHFKFLKSTSFPIPPLPEQRRIVAKIDSLSGKSKRARDHVDHIPRLVEKYKQALLAATFQGKLSGKATNWHQSTVGEVCDLIDGDRGPNYPKREDYLPAGHCLFLSTKNVRPDGFDFLECLFLSEEKHKTLRKGTLSRGDVVITTRGTIGNVAYYSAEIPYDVVRINSGMLIMRPDQRINGEYLAWYVRLPLYKSEIEQQRTGSAQPQLPAGIMKRFPIRFPDLPEQQFIVRSLEATFTWIDKLVAEAANAHKLIDHLDQAILAKALRGELVPQDPNDEPASVILERIQAERVKAPVVRSETTRSRRRQRLAE
jgi:type I restriction enzyme S subunit